MHHNTSPNLILNLNIMSNKSHPDVT